MIGQDRIEKKKKRKYILDTYLYFFVKLSTHCVLIIVNYCIWPPQASQSNSSKTLFWADSIDKRLINNNLSHCIYKIRCFKFLKCDELLLVFVEHDDKLNIFVFWTVGQTKIDIWTLGSYFILCHFVVKTINQWTKKQISILISKPCNIWQRVPDRLIYFKE